MSNYRENMSRRPPRQDLAGDLHQWAMKEMYYQNHRRHVNKLLPTILDFSEICKGEMADIWQFVINNVYSAQTVRKVQGNLVLKQKQSLPHSTAYKVKFGSGEHYDQEKTELLERRRALLAQLTSVRANISHIEKDLRQTQTELAGVDTNYQEVLSRMQDTRRKAAILNSHSQHIQEEIDKMEEYKQRVQNRVKRLMETSSKLSSDEKYYSRSSTSSETGGALESSSTKEVRHCCESVAEFLHKMLLGSSTDRDIGVQHRESLWQQVEAVVGNHSPNQIMLSMSINAQDSAYELKDKTARIDIKRDAEKLRFKYESSGHLSDISTQPSLLRSVHQLMEESQAQQIQSFLETEKCRNHTWKLQSRLSQSQQLMSDWFAQYYKKHDPAMLDLAKSLFETELQVASSRAAIRTLESTAECLKNKISLARCEKEALYAKYQQIQDFKKMADTKQNLIRELVRQNINSRNKLEAQQVEIVQYMEKNFGNQEETTSLLATQLKDSVIQEVDAFAVLSLQNLMFTMLDSAYKITVVDLSINRLSTNQKTAGGQMIKRLLEALEFPSFRAPEDLLSKVVELQAEMVVIETGLQCHISSADDHRPAGHTESSLVQRLAALGIEVNDHDEKQTRRLLPVLQKRLTDISQALTDCLHVKDMLQEWWEQPAQGKASWVKLDDKTLQQWRDKWTVTVTRLRQLSVR